ncbi:MAG: hypothetical protein ABR946_03775 [Solirubrobacteraceae bacterium]
MSANIDGAATPPPELAAHIEAAARAWDSLAASGRRVVFEDTPDRSLQIRLRDDDDVDLGVLTGVELFDLIGQEGGIGMASGGISIAGDRPLDDRGSY